MRRPWATLALLMLLIAASGCQHHQLNITPRAQGVDLILKAPGARTVQLVSSLNQFTPLAAHEIEPGQWHVYLPENMPFRYYYRIDDQLFLPNCQQREMDDFGSRNCIYDPNTYLSETIY